MFNSGFLKSDLSNVKEYKSSGTTPDHFWLSTEPVHDQGSRGICVSVCVHDICKYLYKMKNLSIDYFYNKRKNHSKEGMSPREAFDIARDKNLLSSYALVKNYNSIKLSIVSNGPVLIVIPVYNMNNLNFWEGSNPIGYHAVLFTGYHSEGFIIKNSWGHQWGTAGYAIFPYNHLDKAIEAWTVFK